MVVKTKAVIFDIDGTAIDSPVQKVATSRLVQAVRSAEKYYYLCAATGRAWPYAETVIKSMSLQDPCIVSSGTKICNPVTGEVLWQCNIDAEDVQVALAIMRETPEYMSLYNDYTEEDYLHGGVSPVDLQVSGSVFFLELKHIPQAIAPSIGAKLATIDGIASSVMMSQFPEKMDIHITNKKATKEHAVTELLHILKLEKESSVGVGDNFNDIHIFNSVGYKVAMANSVPELIAMADQTIGNVGDDGFAAYLEGLASHE